MKLLFDHNLSYKLAKRLSDRFPGSLSAKAAGLSTATDLQIWEYAKINDFILVTQMQILSTGIVCLARLPKLFGFVLVTGLSILEKVSF